MPVPARRPAATFLAALLILAAPLAAERQVLLVSAASSLSDALGALKAEGGKAAGLPLEFNFGGSGSLRAQIENGAPVDLFFSASIDEVDRLDRAGFLVEGSRVELLANSLVLIGGAGEVPLAEPGDLGPLLASVPVLAIGNPDSVPAGRYAARALRGLGLLPLLEGRLALGGTVREVLQFVQSGNARFGIVYLTDVPGAGRGPPVKVIFAFPDSALGGRILYSAAIVSASPHRDAARRYLAFLGGPRARAIFAAAGFQLP